jgi:F-type H+-transporting ATPase subunit gamma
MTDRLADVSARIDGIRQLGTVVSAMTGIAAARARTARAQVGAVDAYATTISEAMGRIVGQIALSGRIVPVRPGYLVFCAEQGFAGAFSERVLDSLTDRPPQAPVFMLGTRGAMIASGRGITPAWTGAMPSHSSGVPKLADRIARTVLAAMAADQIDGVFAVYTDRQGGAAVIRRRMLLPLDPVVMTGGSGVAPLINLPVETLFAAMGADYLHALICRIVLHAFAAENEARMVAMSSAQDQIERELADLQAKLRQVRQDEITTEVIELGAGKLRQR